MSRATAWNIVATIWVVTALLLLATCIGDRLDIDIVDVDKDSDPPIMTVTTGPEVGKAELIAWAGRKCHDIMVLQGYIDVKVDALKDYCDKRFDKLDKKVDSIKTHVDKLESKIDEVLNAVKNLGGNRNDH